MHVEETEVELEDAAVITWSGGIGWEDIRKDLMDQPWCAAPPVHCGDNQCLVILPNASTQREALQSVRDSRIDCSVVHLQ